MPGPTDRGAGPRGPEEPPPYKRYRARPRLPSRRARDGSGLEGLRRDRGQPGAGQEGRQRPTGRRIARAVALAVLGWVLVSLAIFMVSAQIEREKVDDDAMRALDDGGALPFTANTVLILGSDLRTRQTAEPGAATEGPSRSDSILLVRVGGGRSARLSIPRDTLVDIPGHGRDKINAAFARGGPGLAIETVRAYLGLEIHHVVEVDFANFPDLVDAMGGIDYTGGCVVSRINGGFRNGGYTLRLKRGRSHLDGKQALALARTRKNECNPRENDLTRARRQQKLFSAMKSRLLSPVTFVRLPWVSWAMPRAIRSDMGGPSLLGLFSALATSGSPPTRVLRPTGAATLPDGSAGLVVSDAERRLEAARFERG